MKSGTTRVVFSPFDRVEGDIRIEVDVEHGAITAAHVTGTCFRGFEPMLRGRDPKDALVITPRVCGQCSAAHLAAASAALRSLSGARVPPNGLLSTAVLLGAEAIINHLTHFYLSFAPDLASRSPDDGETARFRPTGGSAFRAAVEARRALLPLVGLFAGKWPNSLAIQPGGTTRTLDRGELVRASSALTAVREFLEAGFLGDAIGEWLAIRSEADLLAWSRGARPAGSDLGVFLRAAAEGGLDRIGKGPGAFVAADSFEVAPGGFWLRGGVHDGAPAPLAAERITEHVRCSWFEPAGEGGVHPSQGKTTPAPGRAEAYSWMKAPRYDGRPAEAGPIARMLLGGDPLIIDLHEKKGPVVLVRELARLHEMLRLVAVMGDWIAAIRPDEPFLAVAGLPESGDGFGLVEAPRGMLGHWLSVRQGKIREYQIITPTAWNFSPRDAGGIPGPVESALVGVRHGAAGISGDASSVVKSFDPCLFCAVH